MDRFQLSYDYLCISFRGGIYSRLNEYNEVHRNFRRRCNVVLHWIRGRDVAQL